MTDGHFDEMLRRLKLTSHQWDDALTKWTGVSKFLYSKFYEGDYDEHTRLIFGSYGKKTQIRPIGDVDLLFKIPEDVYIQYRNNSNNGPSALLQKVRALLKDEKYTTTDKISSWGKVVLVEFPEGRHNIELLPAYELEDGKFIIPNSENGGTWDTFDPRREMQLIKESDRQTGLTRSLIKIIKRWKNYSNISLKSYRIEEYCLKYLENNNDVSKSWSEIITNFFDSLASQLGEYHDDYFKADIAKNRSAKARSYEKAENFEKACEEWIKIFGDKFPIYESALEKIYKLEKDYPSPAEEFIEDLFPVRIDPDYTLTIVPTIKANGFREHSVFSQFMQIISKLLPKNASLLFKADSNISGNVKYYWKVRNFGEEAENIDDGNGLRGEIIKDDGSHQKKEGTLYQGIHYVECYAIVNDVCVAKNKVFVPIGAVE